MLGHCMWQSIVTVTGDLVWTGAYANIFQCLSNCFLDIGNLYTNKRHCSSISFPFALPNTVRQALGNFLQPCHVQKTIGWPQTHLCQAADFPPAHFFNCPAILKSWPRGFLNSTSRGPTSICRSAPLRVNFDYLPP